MAKIEVKMERVMGFEPTASTLARLRSSQLSYTRKKLTVKNYHTFQPQENQAQVI